MESNMNDNSNKNEKKQGFFGQLGDAVKGVANAFAAPIYSIKIKRRARKLVDNYLAAITVAKSDCANADILDKAVKKYPDWDGEVKFIEETLKKEEWDKNLIDTVSEESDKFVKFRTELSSHYSSKGFAGKKIAYFVAKKAKQFLGGMTVSKEAAALAKKTWESTGLESIAGKIKNQENLTFLEQAIIKDKTLKIKKGLNIETITNGILTNFEKAEGNYSTSSLAIDSLIRKRAYSKLNAKGDSSNFDIKCGIILATCMFEKSTSKSCKNLLSYINGYSKSFVNKLSKFFDDNSHGFTMELFMKKFKIDENANLETFLNNVAGKSYAGRYIILMSLRDINSEFASSIQGSVGLFKPLYEKYKKFNYIDNEEFKPLTKTLDFLCNFSIHSGNVNSLSDRIIGYLRKSKLLDLPTGAEARGVASTAGLPELEKMTNQIDKGQYLHSAKGVVPGIERAKEEKEKLLKRAKEYREEVTKKDGTKEMQTFIRVNADSAKKLQTIVKAIEADCNEKANNTSGLLTGIINGNSNKNLEEILSKYYAAFMNFQGNKLEFDILNAEINELSKKIKKNQEEVEEAKKLKDADKAAKVVEELFVLESSVQAKKKQMDSNVKLEYENSKKLLENLEPDMTKEIQTVLDGLSAKKNEIMAKGKDKDVNNFVEQLSMNYISGNTKEGENLKETFKRVVEGNLKNFISQLNECKNESIKKYGNIIQALLNTFYEKIDNVQARMMKIRQMEEEQKSKGYESEDERKKAIQKIKDDIVKEENKIETIFSGYLDRLASIIKKAESERIKHGNKDIETIDKFINDLSEFVALTGINDRIEIKEKAKAEAEAATKIQKALRGYNVRKKLKKMEDGAKKTETKADEKETEAKKEESKEEPKMPKEEEKAQPAATQENQTSEVKNENIPETPQEQPAPSRNEKKKVNENKNLFGKVYDVGKYALDKTKKGVNYATEATKVGIEKGKRLAKDSTKKIKDSAKANYNKIVEEVGNLFSKGDNKK